LKDYVNQYTAIARKSRDAGNQFWGVLVGTPADAEAAAWVEAKFKQFGLEVKKQDVNTPTVWSPQSWQVSASSGGTTLKIDSASPITGTPGTSASGVDVEAVWVGTGLPLDFAGKDVRGKAAVIYSNAVPGLNTAATNGAMRRAFEKGAASIIVILATPGNAAGVGIPGQSVNSRGATSNAPVPVQMMVGLKDGTALQEMIEKAAPGQPVRVRVRADIQTKQNVSAPMLMGVLPGMTDENIMVSAHRDSWYEGAQDNASGMSVMVGLAEYFS
jgi:Iap family predicted aminopeptidase